jgi:hypothetical protein
LEKIVEFWGVVGKENSCFGAWKVRRLTNERMKLELEHGRQLNLRNFQKIPHR